MDVPNIIGFAGALIAGYAYLPQIRHLVKEHCSAGISRSAFALWFISSVLVTINAVFIYSVVFTVLGAIQLSSTGVIYVLSTRYWGQACPVHARGSGRGQVDIAPRTTDGIVDAPPVEAKCTDTWQRPARLPADPARTGVTLPSGVDTTRRAKGCSSPLGVPRPGGRCSGFAVYQATGNDTFVGCATNANGPVTDTVTAVSTGRCDVCRPRSHWRAQDHQVPFVATLRVVRVPGRQAGLDDRVEGTGAFTIRDHDQAITRVKGALRS